MTSPLPVLPQIIVEAGLVPDSPAQGGTTLFLNTGPGLGTGTLGTATGWTAISPWVISFTTSRPSTRLAGPLWNYQAATASITLDNADGRFDPDNLAGPYVTGGVTQLAAMVPVRIRCNFGAVTYPLFSGFADGWLPAQVTYEGGYAELTVPATDAFKVLAGVTLPATPVEGVGADTGARIRDILTRAGWYTSAERNVIDTGNSLLQGTTLGADALSLMQVATDSEIGQLYVNGAGAVVFRRRQALLSDTRSSTVQAIFGDLPGTDHGVRAGAYLRLADMGQPDTPAAAAAFTAITGRPVTACRVYFGLSTFPGSITPDLAWMAGNGVKACITLRPAYNPVSATDLANMTTFLASCKNAGLTADITLWHEPFFSGLTAAQYIAMAQYYGPTVRSYYPLVFCTAVSSVAANNENSYYPGDAWIDKIATDFYCYQYLPAAGSLRLDQAASVADNAVPPKPFGIWEYNSAVLDLFNTLTGQSAGFEGGTGTWVQTGNCTLASTAAQARTGSNSMSLTSAAAGNISAGSVNVLTTGMPVSPGDSATCTAWFRSAVSARSVQVGITWANSGGTSLGTTFGSTVTSTTTGWTQAPELTATAPAGAAFAEARVFVLGTGGAGEVHYADDVFLSNGQLQGDAAAFFAYIQSFMAARRAAGKANADVLLFNGGTTDFVLTNVITSSGDYRVPMFGAIFDALNSSGVPQELPVAAITRASDDTTIANDIQATRAGSSSLQEVKDTTSIAKYLFPRTYSRSDLILQNDSDALNWAQWVLYVAKGGEDRFESLAVDPQAAPADLWPQVLGRDIGDRIQVWHRPAGVATRISKDCFITGVTHTWDSVNSTWLTTWTLMDASKYGSFLTLDNPTLGKLDSNALAF